MTITVTDLFCGAGGSSIGIHAAGAKTVMAANHWQLAVDTHQDNFPDADHDCADISQVDPRRYPPTDILWASPSCTNHSQAKGVARATGQGELWESALPDEAAERSRATMWDVVRFLEAKKMLRGQHAYRAAIVENVVDAAKWVLFPAWRAAIEALSYDVHPVYLNSMHAWSGKASPAPQSRDRVYFVIVPRGVQVDLDIRPSAWCTRCEADVDARQVWKRPAHRWGRYRAQYVYVCPQGHGQVEPYALPAATAIDWALIGERIGDRARPLKPATVRRIEAGLRKYGRPSLVPAGGTWNDTGTPVDEPARTRTTRETEALLIPPVLMSLSRLNDTAKQGSPVTGPWPTQTGRQDLALLLPPMVVSVGGNTYERPGSGYVRAWSTDQPMTTRAATHGDYLVVPPFIAELRGGSSESRPVSEPLATMTASGTHHMLVCPPKLVMDYYRTGQLRRVDEPLQTVTTVDRFAAIDPADLVDDCLFRMLAPHEIGAAMAFPSTYRVGGNKRERVRMYGNAVTPPAAALLIERVTAALDSKAAA